MTYITEQQAAEKACPVARTFAEWKGAKCDGAKCILWRWRIPLATDQVFLNAVKAETVKMIEQDGGKGGPHRHKKAVAAVMSDKEGYGLIPTTGFCGLGSRP